MKLTALLQIVPFVQNGWEFAALVFVCVVSVVWSKRG